MVGSRAMWYAVVTGAVVAAAVLAWAVGTNVTSNNSASNSSAVSLTIARDPTTGLYTMSPAQLHVARASVLRIMITNWDPTAHAPTGTGNSVSGTMMGGEMVGWGNGSWSNLTSMPMSRWGHTFTMMGMGYHLQVPIPVAWNATTPSIVVFEMRTGMMGTMAWSCDGYSSGMMNGSFYVG